MAKTLLLTLGFMFLYGTSAIRIGSWPQSRVTSAVLPMETQLDIYARILGFFDIVAMSNIPDPTELYQVMETLKDEYEMILSTRMAKPRFNVPTEYYAFIYRKDVVSLSDLVRDQPTGAFCAKVHVPHTNQTFVMAIVHLASSDVPGELELLFQTSQRLPNIYNVEDILFVGDFNTVDSFVPPALLNNVTIAKDPKFQWYIDQNTFVHTGLSGPAARFLAYNYCMHRWIINGTDSVWDIGEYFNITYEETIGISVFYPVQIDMFEPILRP